MDAADPHGRLTGFRRAFARGSFPRFVAVRLAATVVLLVVVSFLVFSLLHLAPGDPARNLLGPRAATPELLARLRARYHLDQPFLTQYARWIGEVLRGDLGRSIRGDLRVTTLLAQRAGLTFHLAAMAFVLTVGVAVPLGVSAAWRAGSRFDRTVSAISIVGVGAPTFAIGLVLLYVFGVWLGAFPVYGSGEGFLDRTWHLALPAITLATGIGAFVFKLTRTAVLGELRQDYVTFAEGRGLPRARVRRIVLRNALVPVVTSLGLLFAFLFGGTVLVEYTFAVQGLGSLLAASIAFKDIPVVQAITLAVAAVIALTALAVDLLYFAVDPRIRKRAAA